MKKRLFLILSISLFLTACSNHKQPNPNFNISNKEKIHIYSQNDKNYKKIYQIIKAIKLDYKDSLRKTEYFQMPYSEIPGVNHNLIWVAGPDPLLTRDMFHVKKYADNNLMIVGNGIKDNITYIFKKMYKVQNPDKEAQKVGYANFKELFNTVFERVSNEPTNKLIDNLIKLDKKGYIDTSNIFLTVNGFKKKLNSFIYYANEEYFYYMYGEKRNNNINAIKVLNESKFYILNKFKEPIYFESKDYEIYAFTLDLCYEFIKKGGKGINVL